MNIRDELVEVILKAQNDLKKYDDFFSTLQKGSILIEYGMYDDFDVKVVSWDSEKGTIVGEYIAGGETQQKTYTYWELHLETRNMHW